MHNPTAPPPTLGVTVEPFRIDVPEAVLIDLRDRLARVRWPDEPPGAGWNYGTDLAYLQNLVRYWRDGYDWRAREAHLNRFPQFRTRQGDALVLPILGRRRSAQEELLFTLGVPAAATAA